MGNYFKPNSTQLWIFIYMYKTSYMAPYHHVCHFIMSYCQISYILYVTPSLNSILSFVVVSSFFFEIIPSIFFHPTTLFLWSSLIPLFIHLFHLTSLLSQIFLRHIFSLCFSIIFFSMSRMPWSPIILSQHKKGLTFKVLLCNVQSKHRKWLDQGLNLSFIWGWKICFQRCSHPFKVD